MKVWEGRTKEKRKMEGGIGTEEDGGVIREGGERKKKKFKRWRRASGIGWLMGHTLMCIRKIQAGTYAY